MSRQALPGILETTMRLSELTPTELADLLARAYAADHDEAYPQRCAQTGRHHWNSPGGD